jgi:hypothetical protein
VTLETAEQIASALNVDVAVLFVRVRND